MSRTVQTLLTDEQRKEATRRVMAGEKSTNLAIEYGCTRAYISLLKAQVLFPERYEKKRVSLLTRALSAEQLAEFKQVIETSDPSKLGLDPPTRAWCMDHGYQLAERMFKKRLSKRVVKECLEPILRVRDDRILRRPQPPEVHHISQLSPEFAKNEEFVEYYLSPLGNKIARREYELALADWISRYGDATEIDLDSAPPRPAEDVVKPTKPQVYKSKHSQAKGSPFTASKKKKRKKA